MDTESFVWGMLVGFFSFALLSIVLTGAQMYQCERLVDSGECRYVGYIGEPKGE